MACINNARILKNERNRKECKKNIYNARKKKASAEELFDFKNNAWMILKQ